VLHVNPPPRVYLQLTPWVCLLASGGIGVLIARIPATRIATWTGTFVAGVILLFGILYSAAHPVLFAPEERTSYVSVTAVIARSPQEIGPADFKTQRLIAPLPCDLPSIFYMVQGGWQIEVNGTPQRGETVWLIARRDETPEQVLRSNL